MDEVKQSEVQQAQVENATMQKPVDLMGRVTLGVDETKFPPATKIGPGAYWVKARNPMPNHPFANYWHIAYIYEWNERLIHMECGSIMVQDLSPQFCALFDWIAIEAPGEIATSIPKDMIRVNAVPAPVPPMPAPMPVAEEAPISVSVEEAPAVVPDAPNVVAFPGKQ